MTKKELYVSLLAEECSELGQIAIKLLRFGENNVRNGQEKTNAERVVEEFKDLYSIMEILKTEGVIEDFIPDEEYLQARFARVDKYMKISQELGLVQ